MSTNRLNQIATKILFCLQAWPHDIVSRKSFQPEPHIRYFLFKKKGHKKGDRFYLISDLGKNLFSRVLVPPRPTNKRCEGVCELPASQTSVPEGLGRSKGHKGAKSDRRGRREGQNQMQKKTNTEIEAERYR